MTEKHLTELASRITNERARENWLNFMRSVELQSPSQVVKVSNIREIERSRLVTIEQVVDNPFDIDEQLLENVGINSQDNYGNTILHNATMDGDIDLVILLLSDGIDKIITNHAGDTAADVAAQLGEIDILNLLK